MDSKTYKGRNTDLDQMLGDIGKFYRNCEERIRITVTLGEDRSNDQNRLIFQRYKELWMACKFDDIAAARAHCKLEYGIPILERDRPGFKEGFEALCNAYTLYPQYQDDYYGFTLKMMTKNVVMGGDGFPVTSQFTIKQCTEYIERIQLEFPDVAFKDLQS